MPVFTSARERRLWAYTLAVVVAIYSTLGLARILVDELGSDFLSIWLFLLGCILVLATVITQGLKVRPAGMEIGVALGIAAAYLLIVVRMAVPTERSHLVEYGVVAVFIHEALIGAGQPGTACSRTGSACNCNRIGDRRHRRGHPMVFAQPRHGSRWTCCSTCWRRQWRS